MFIKRLSSLLSAIRGVSSAVSEVVDVSPGNLDSSLCFIQPSISHDVLCTAFHMMYSAYKLNKQGDNIQP